MPFTLSEDHLAFQRSVRTLARSRYADSMLARSQSEKFPTAEFGELGAAGLLGLLISESAGGQGGDVLAVGIAVEELAYADPAIAYLAFAANVSNALLAAHGSDEVQQRYRRRGRHLPRADRTGGRVRRGESHSAGHPGRGWMADLRREDLDHPGGARRCRNRHRADRTRVGRQGHRNVPR